MLERTGTREGRIEADLQTIETDLTDEENAMIEESLAEYRADPSSVTPWRKVRKG